MKLQQNHASKEKANSAFIVGKIGEASNKKTNSKNKNTELEIAHLRATLNTMNEVETLKSLVFSLAIGGGVETIPQRQPKHNIKLK